MSNRLTFSLASLIFLIALGLVFAPMSVMAETGGPTVTITEYTGNNGTGVKHVQTRGDFRVKVEFSHVVGSFDPTIATHLNARKAASKADSLSTSLVVGNVTGGTAATDVPDSELTTDKVFVATVNLNDANFNAGYLSIVIPADAVNGNSGANLLGNQSGSFETEDLVKATAWTVSLALDESTLTAAEKDGDKLAASAVFDVKVMLIPGTGSQPSLNVSQLRINGKTDANVAGISITTTGDIDFQQGVNGSVTYTVGAEAIDAVKLSVNSQYMGGNTITVPEPGPAPAPNPTVTLSQQGDIDTAMKTFRVRLEFSKAVSNLAASNVKVFKAKADGTISTTAADVAEPTVTKLGGGTIWIAEVNYEFETLPLFVTVDSSIVSEMTPTGGLPVGGGVTPPPAGAPAAPTGVAAAADQATDMVTLTWTASTDATSYKIAQTGQATANYTATASPFTTPALAPGDYMFTVVATNATGDSSPSASVSATIDAPTVPNNPPVFPAGETIADIVIWKGHEYTTPVLPKATDDEGDTLGPYTITPDLPDGLRLVANDAQDRTITGTATAASAEAAYKFIATDSKGATAELKFNVTVLDPIVPTAPTAVMAMEEGDLGPLPANLLRTVNSNKVVTTWTAPVDETKTSHDPAIPFGAAITGYMVYQTNEAGMSATYPPTGADAIKKDAASYTTPQALAVGEYNFEVAAVNSAGTGAKSTPKAPVTVANPPGVPSDLRAAKVPTNPKAVTLNWLLPGDGGLPIAGYIIYHTLDGAPEPEIKIGAGVTHTVSGLKSGRHVFRVAAFNADGLGNKSMGTEFSVDVPVDPTNNPPTFGDKSIAHVTAAVGTAITGVTLPAATDADGDALTYEISPTLPTGLDFNETTRFLHGTPTAAMASTVYTYSASDGKAGGTASLNFTIEVKGKAVVPASGDLPATHVNGVTTITSGMIAANGFATIGSAHLPDLEEFFDLGGTIGLSNGDATDDKNSRTVVISEILWGLDLGAPVDQQTQFQFIELYNTTGAAIDLTSWTLTFTAGRPVPASDIDQVSNRSGAGWNLDKNATHGQSGRVTGTLATDLASAITPTNIISMYRNINYDHVEKNVAKRDELVKGIPGGNGSGSWKASQRRSAYNRWIYDSKRAEHFKSTDILTASAVARSPFIINEVGNNAGDTNDWVEIRNVTDAEASLKNYHLSYVSGFDKDTSLVNFHDKDIKVPAKSVILLVNTDPKNTGIAAGQNAAIAEADQELTGVTSRYYINSNLKLPDDGKFNLILRNAHDKLKASSHFMDVIGGLVVADATKGTSLWPLVATGGPHGNVIEGHGRDFKAPYVYIRKNAGGGTGEKHLGRVGYTGVGYDRVVLKSDANGGTPGYDNGAVKEKIADLVAADSAAEVTISEIMLETAEGRLNLPQWIELYNSSMTHSVNTNGWKLHVENASDVETALDSVLTLGSMTIPPNQTILIVTNTGRVSDPDHFPSTRLVNLWTTKAHRDALEMVRRTDQVFSTTGLYLKLTDKDNKLVDECGNLDGNRRTRDEPNWAIPVGEDDGRRSSLIRVYDAGVAVDGKMAEAWVLADVTNLAYAISATYYGDSDDFGTPGFRGGGPLPVSLSKFRPERLDDGSIVVRWITESELNNAGFNILRSETRNGEFTKINTSLIKGQGTTSERTPYEWKDSTAKPNVVYYYQIQDVSLDGQVQTLRQSRLKGNVTAAGKLTTTWGELKALQ